jgi:hypothetical protein
MNHLLPIAPAQIEFCKCLHSPTAPRQLTVSGHSLEVAAYANVHWGESAQQKMKLVSLVH